MKRYNRKQGISLIVLAITVIVMIILAATVIISLTDTGVIGKADTAVSETNLKEVQQLAELAWIEATIDKVNGVEVSIEESVEQALANKNIDTSRYVLVFSSNGVTVKDKNSISGKWELIRKTDASGKVTSLKVTNEILTLDVGTTINYMPDGVGLTDYTGGWKILGVDDEGRLLILSNESITGGTLTLGSASVLSDATTSYMNTLTTLQSAVSSYKDGTIGVEVRSITLEDIDKLTGYDKTTFGEGDTIAYGNKVTYSWNGNQFPEFSYGTTTGSVTAYHGTDGFTYYDEASNKIITAPYTTTAGTVITTLTHSYYGYDFIDYIDESLAAYDMLYNTVGGQQNYWLATRFISAALAPFSNIGIMYADFGVQHIKDGSAGGTILFCSHARTNTDAKCIRAVVTLNLDAQLKKGSVSGTYDITLAK